MYNNKKREKKLRRRTPEKRLSFKNLSEIVSGDFIFFPFCRASPLAKAKKG
jgi:hypothetical protein